MPAIELMPWDSQLLGLHIGRASGEMPPSAAQMQDYDMLLARLPLNADAALASYQASGFQMVAMDLTLSADILSFGGDSSSADYRMVWLDHEKPRFSIDGFCIEDSRLMLDIRCRKRLPTDFWDKLIYEHCCEYADAVLCALDAKAERLLGFVSCFFRDDTFELFTVAVHPQYQGKGIGKAMLQQAATRAQSQGLKIDTQVLASNLGAMNFYLNHGFRPVSGELVLHHWKDGID